MIYPVISLRPGKEAALHYHHPWVFSGALQQIPDTVQHGDLVYLVTSTGEIIATGMYSRHSQIAVRILEFAQAAITQDWFVKQFRARQAEREMLGYGPKTPTNSYRLIFGESDGIPGLIIDRYNQVFVMQINTAGMDRLREMIIAALQSVFSPDCIVEKSDTGERLKEQLSEVTGIVFGALPDSLLITEYGLEYIVDPLQGQKTGFFLDQKDLRQRVRQWAKGKTVLNLFSYTGAAGMAALAGGAVTVCNVDASEEALAGGERHRLLAGYSPEHLTQEKADIFQWLSDGSRRGQTYGMVLMDPPALIKSQKDQEHGLKAYHFLNRAAMRLVEPGGLFVTSSCSQYLSEEDLLNILKRASIQNNRRVRIIDMVQQAPDHPISPYFPESFYLKSIVCMVE
ncbi:MAG: class I SAM-dependent rRNA methyltransferase [Candidatus Kerfeldbacteria bacterium]|nr:class I SAM-dependent rRNA methyltransferase [Candidatus Kerfeldbacteria bacterium]